MYLKEVLQRNSHREKVFNPSMNQLQIPKNKKTKGLYVFCNKCKSKSKRQLLANAKCSHPADKQVFKTIITVAGTKSVRTLSHNTRDLDIAIRESVEFEKELIAIDYRKPDKNQIKESNPVTLRGCTLLYLDFLENKNVYEHQKKIRSKPHLEQVALYLSRFEDSLEIIGINSETFLIRHITNKHVEIFHNYLLSQELSNRTYNRHMDTVSELFNYLIQIKQYDLINYFSSINVKRKPVRSRIETISVKEFKKLLDTITPENGIEKTSLSNRDNTNRYFPWIRDAFELALYTGRRRDEIVNMKFSDIKEADGTPIYIETEDYKYNLRNNLYRAEEKKYNYTPIIKDLMNLLLRLGYEKYKGSDRYLIAPESNKTRSTIKEDISRSFTFYVEKLGLSKHITFKNLRKTYITLLNNFTHGSAESITGHSGQGIILRSYQDQKVFNNVLNNFTLDSSDNF